MQVLTISSTNTDFETGTRSADTLQVADRHSPTWVLTHNALAAITSPYRSMTTKCERRFPSKNGTLHGSHVAVARHSRRCSHQLPPRISFKPGREETPLSVLETPTVTTPEPFRTGRDPNRPSEQAPQATRPLALRNEALTRTAQKAHFAFPSLLPRRRFAG